MYPELINHIKKERQAGKSDAEIKNELLDAGWKESDVNGGFRSISSEIDKLKLRKEEFKENEEAGLNKASLSENNPGDIRGFGILTFFKFVFAIYIFFTILAAILGDLLPSLLADLLSELFPFLIAIPLGWNLIFFLIPFFIGGIIGLFAIREVEKKNPLGLYTLIFLICIGSISIAVSIWTAHLSNIGFASVTRDFIPSIFQPLVASFWVLIYLTSLFYLIFLNKQLFNLGGKLNLFLILIIIEILFILGVVVNFYSISLKETESLKQMQAERIRILESQVIQPTTVIPPTVKQTQPEEKVMITGPVITPVLFKNVDKSILGSFGFSWSGQFPIYGGGPILDWVDINTFALYPGTPYLKDKNGVYNLYFGGLSRMDGADPETFAVYSYEFAKDKNRIYIYGITEYPPDLDVPTFQGLGANYYKDKKNVYLGHVIYEETKATKYNQDSYWRLEKISGFDAETFQFLGVCGCVEKSCSYYVKDIEGAYCGYDDKLEKIQGADSQTFVYVGQFDENPGGLPVSSGIAKDKNCVYRGGKKVVDANGACVNPIACTAENLIADCRLK